ncbi:MAG: hypothetical protein AMJ64_07575 [Betaproteobacteria bacterium SG8_39]|nr:MAG: hypothetical protein AMJ64_07575 [Betaproteobacteria bacterium SG8_39]
MLHAGTAQAAGVDPQAEKLLKASTDFLAAQKRFSVDTRSTLEVVLESGQKLQFDHAVRATMRRPNKLRAERVGDLIDQVFYYDGKSLTLYNPGAKFYATVAAPGTLEEMLDYAREKLDIVAPAGDLLYRNAFEILMTDVTDGFIVGKAAIEGARCVHLAFRAPHVDWQIWIEDGKRPLPRKLVITSRDVVNAPQFTTVMTKWKLAPKVSQRLFEFRPPKGAKKVEFLPLVGETQSR